MAPTSSTQRLLLSKLTATAARPRPHARAPRHPPLASRKPSSEGAIASSPVVKSPLRDTRLIGRHLQALNEGLLAPQNDDLAAGASPVATIPVEFRVQFHTRLGQDIHLVGSSPHLGEWSVAHACPLKWTAGGVWTTTVQLPAGGIFFYKFFLKEDGYLKEWQGGNNIMLVLPLTAAEVATLPLVAESLWTGAPSCSSLASEARVVARMHQVDALVQQAEAAAYAAGQVAQTVMSELLVAREETAVAMRFITDKGLTKEFNRVVGKDLTDLAPGANKAKGTRGSRSSAATESSSPAVRSDADIDAEIDATLAQQLAGTIDLSPPDAQTVVNTGNRVDLSAADAFDASSGNSTAQRAAPRPLILNTDGDGARQTAR